MEVYMMVVKYLMTGNHLVTASTPNIHTAHTHMIFRKSGEMEKEKIKSRMIVYIVHKHKQNYYVPYYTYQTGIE